MKFLIDQPVSPLLAEWLRADANHDAFHVRERGMSGASDEEIFALAVQESRIIITTDLDFSRIVALSGFDGPGVILFRAGNISDEEMLSLLQRALERITAAILEHAVVVVEPTSMRVARLPLRPNLIDVDDSQV